MLDLINNKKGLSILEILVAFSIISFVFIAIMVSFPKGISITKRAENNTVAFYLAQDKIEEIYSLGYENINMGEIEIKARLSGDSNNYLYAFFRETKVNYVDGNIEETEIDTGLKKISTTVYYPDAIHKGEKSYNITTLIHQR